jgi:hypothetical protein
MASADTGPAWFDVARRMSRIGLIGAAGPDTGPAVMGRQRISRQLRRQRRLRAQGLCIICAEPAARKVRKRDRRPFVASRCEPCLAAQRRHYARKTGRRVPRAPRG